MNFKEIAENRYSCRAYDPARVVEKEKLDYVLKAATIAPTGVNYQPFKVYVIDTKKNKDALSEIYPAEWFVQPPYVLCVVSQKDKVAKYELWIPTRFGVDFLESVANRFATANDLHRLRIFLLFRSLRNGDL